MRRSSLRRITALLFFLSGASALILQIVWVRMLGLVFGVTAFAVSAVLSAFMAGLALGNYVGGRVIDRRTDPLRVFGGLKLGVAFFALSFPLLLSGLSDLYVLIYRRLFSDFYVFNVLRFLLAFGLLLIPTVLMGATLPVVARFYVDRLDRVGPDVGVLYSVNNWGAAIGAVGAGFVLLETLGVRQAGYFAALISGGAGLTAWLLHMSGAAGSPAEAARQPSAETPPAEPVPPPAERQDEAARYPPYVLAVVLVVFGLEGFTSLGYEVVWTRILAGLRMILDIYGYTLVTGTFIAGLALGSLLVGRFARSGKHLLTVLGALEVGIGLSALLLMPVFRWASESVRGCASWGWWFAEVAVWLGALMLIPTTLMGATFPVVSRIYTVNFRELGRRLGKIGCLDTVGSIFGAFAGSFVLIYLLGMQDSVVALAAMNLLLGAAVFACHPGMSRRMRAACLVAVVLLGAGAWHVVPLEGPFQPPFPPERTNHHVYYDEGVGATVSVQQFYTGRRDLVIDGLNVAGSGDILRTTQVWQGHVPALVYRSARGRPARRVLTIGLGTGHTSWILSKHDFEDIHCVELYSAVKRAAQKHFRELNHDVFSDPRYELFIQDARTFLTASDRKYDMILGDAVHPAFGGNASLFTRDFFRDWRDSLTEEGVASTWLPFNALTREDLGMIVRTFRDVFPHAMVWYAVRAGNRNALLLGSRSELTIDFQRFRSIVMQPRVNEDFAELGFSDPFSVLSSFMFGERTLERFARGASVHTDNHPYLQFSAVRHALCQDRLPGNLASLGRYRTSPLPYLTNLGSTAEQRELVTQKLQREKKLSDTLYEAWTLYKKKRLKESAELALLGLRESEDGARFRELLSQIYYVRGQRKGDIEFSLEMCEKSLEYDPGNLKTITMKAWRYFQDGQFREAARVLEEALENHPEFLQAHLDLSRYYRTMGRPDKALEHLRAFMKVVPGEPKARRRLRELQQQ